MILQKEILLNKIFPFLCFLPVFSIFLCYYYYLPSVINWFIPATILSHSSSLGLEPHSPSRGLQINDLHSTSVKGTLVPSSSGNTAEIHRKANLVKTCDFCYHSGYLQKVEFTLSKELKSNFVNIWLCVFSLKKSMFQGSIKFIF